MLQLPELILHQTKLKDFSPTSKIWFYSSEVSFDKHKDSMEKSIFNFTQNWKSHADNVRGHGFTIGGHIIILVADSAICEVSGCSTDSSVNFIRQLGQEYNLNLFDRELVLLWFKDKIQPVKLAELVNYPTDTLVFNPFFSSLEDWRGSFIQKLSESKFKRFLARV